MTFNGFRNTAAFVLCSFASSSEEKTWYLLRPLTPTGTNVAGSHFSSTAVPSTCLVCSLPWSPGRGYAPMSVRAIKRYLGLVTPFLRFASSGAKTEMKYFVEPRGISKKVGAPSAEPSMTEWKCVQSHLIRWAAGLQGGPTAGPVAEPPNGLQQLWGCGQHRRVLRTKR